MEKDIAKETTTARNVSMVDENNTLDLTEQLQLMAAISVDELVFLVGSTQGGQLVRVLHVTAAGEKRQTKKVVQLVRDIQHPSGERFVGVLSGAVPCEGNLNFVAELKSGTEIEFDAEVQPYNAYQPLTFFDIYRAATPLLEEVLETMLPPDHELRQAVQNFNYIKKTSVDEFPRLVGHFDQVFDGCAEGWVYAADNPKARLLVEIIADGRVVARGLANKCRSDLAEQNIGDGHYRFQLKLADSLWDGRRHLLVARVERTKFILESKWLQLHGMRQRADFFDPISYEQALAMCATVTPRWVQTAKGTLTVEQCLAEATLALDTGSWDIAGRAFLSMAELFGKHPMFYCKAAEAVFLEGDMERSCSLYEMAIAMDSEFACANFGLGNCYARQGKWGIAISAYEKAINAGLDAAKARLKSVISIQAAEQGRQLLAIGDVSGAVQCLGAAMRNNAEDRTVAELLLAAMQQESSLPSLPAALHEVMLDKLMLDYVLDQAETYIGKLVV